MIAKRIQTLLIDIEGTTSSISFVHEVMFGFVRQHLRGFLASHWDLPEVQAAIQQVAVDANRDLASWLPSQSVATAQEVLASHLLECMDRDLKATGLKSLQGILWRQGFHSGELKAHLFPEVADSLRRWKGQGFDLRIYSSGSREAQQLYFRHTIDGDLLPLFTAHYDTTIGNKRQAESYRRIVVDIGQPADTILFLSDIYEELQAASEAGLQVMASVRPGNAPLPDNCPFKIFRSMDEIVLDSPAS